MKDIGVLCLMGGGHKILSQRNISMAVGKIHIGGLSLTPHLAQAMLGVAPTINLDYQALGFVDTATHHFQEFSRKIYGGEIDG